MMNARTSKSLRLVLILALISSAWCMSGGPYVLECSTIAGSGGTSSGGNYQVVGDFGGGAPTLHLPINIDIYPNRTPNRVFLSRYYTIYVGVLGSAGFDVTTLDSATVKFGRTGTEASPVRAPMIRDLNGDGEADALYGFWTFDCGFQLGDTQGWLKGSTTSGTLVEGSDSVLVLP